MPAPRMRSPLGRAQGLGSAKEGVEHWWLQRLTAVALVPLAVWFAAVVIRLAGADLATVRAWVGRPAPAILLTLMLIATFWHMALGLQVVIEDYVAAPLVRLGFVVLLRLACFGLAVAGIFSVFSMTLAAPG